MEDSIFTKIIKGEIPCHKVYEDEATMAFMDIYPIQPGAVLVISKTQVDHFTDLSKADYDALMETVRVVSRRVRRVFPDKARVGIIIEGFDVPHVHVKVVPINSGHELRHLPDMKADPDHAALAEYAKRLTA